MTEFSIAAADFDHFVSGMEKDGVATAEMGVGVEIFIVEAFGQKGARGVDDVGEALVPAGFGKLEDVETDARVSGFWRWAARVGARTLASTVSPCLHLRMTSAWASEGRSGATEQDVMLIMKILSVERGV